MNKAKIALAAVAVSIWSTLGLPVQQTTPEDQQKAMEAYMKAMAVTENHRLLEFFVGKWDFESTMWTFPGTPPSTSKNTGEFTSILGGRFAMMKFSGTMMGQPVEGVQITGYDNIQQKFVTFWIDSTSTALFLLSGTYDPATKAWTDKGEWANPMGGMTPVRSVTRILGPDEYSYEMFMGMPDGTEFKSLVNRCTRKK